MREWPRQLLRDVRRGEKIPSLAGARRGMTIKGFARLVRLSYRMTIAVGVGRSKLRNPTKTADNQGLRSLGAAVIQDDDLRGSWAEQAPQPSQNGCVKHFAIRFNVLI
jgi:hypothetical protein